VFYYKGKWLTIELSLVPKFNLGTRKAEQVLGKEVKLNLYRVLYFPLLPNCIWEYLDNSIFPNKIWKQWEDKNPNKISFMLKFVNYLQYKGKK